MDSWLPKRSQTRSRPNWAADYDKGGWPSSPARSSEFPLPLPRNRREPRHRILALEHCYHGDTVGGLSVGQRGVFNQAHAALLFEVQSIPVPPTSEQETLDALEQRCRSSETAAFIVEPLILAAGGMLI